MRNIGKIYNQIKLNFDIRDFKTVIELSEEYLKIPNIEINPIILYFYGVALLKEKEPEKALEIFNMAYKIGANSKTLTNMGRSLINAGMQFEADKYFEKAIMDLEYKDWIAYFLLGKSYYYEGKNEQAQVLLEKSLSFTNGDRNKISKTNSVLAKVISAIKKGVRKTEYEYYAKTGKKIVPGCIVDLKYGTRPIAQSALDTDVSAKPYLVLCVEENLVYAITLTGDKRNGYQKENENSSSPRYITKKAIVFNVSDIKSVIIDNSSINYQTLANKIYHYLCHHEQDKLEESQILLMQAMNRDLKPNIHDLVTICQGVSPMVYKYYFILNEEEECNAVEVICVNGMFIATSNYVTISPDTIISDKVTLDKEAINIILNDITTNQGRH